MTRPEEGKPEKVLEQTRQSGESRSRWAWVEPTVWTERMLAALENGVKGGRWHSLIDKIWSINNLRSGYQQVARNRGAAGIDHVSVEEFGKNLEEEVWKLSKELREGRYKPQGIKRVWIPKPGSQEKRPLGIPTVRDRVVQTAVLKVLEPIYEKEFAEHSYGFRPGKGAKDALRRVSNLLKEGYERVVDADIKGYFDQIPHGQLVDKLRERISDSRTLELLEGFLHQEIVDQAERWKPTKGSPQGAIISPLLSNIYLNDLDHKMKAEGYELTRYADDFIVQCQTQEEAEGAMKVVAEWVKEAGLELHPEKSGIRTHEEGFDFLGYHFRRGRKWPRKKSIAKLKETIRTKTKRTNGNSLKTIIQDVNQTLRGWFEYFKHGAKGVFAKLDGWVRMRLRSILRRQSGLKGRGRGADHQKWPNEFFREHGLYSLVIAHVEARQSSRR